jgi:hypothetical protein
MKLPDEKELEHRLTHEILIYAIAITPHASGFGTKFAQESNKGYPDVS